MNDAGSLRRAHGAARLCGLVAAGLGLVVTLTAAGTPSLLHQGAALPSPPGPVTGLPNFLTGVSAVSPSDAWAVGDDPALALHWNGTRWVRTAIPHSGSALSSLEGVSALSASDAWAVGSRGDVRTTTLALHWNGTAWTRVATPSPGMFPQLTSVSAVSPADAWAVGAQPAMALHWNGTTWVQTAVPHPAGSALSGVSALSASDAWAVGESGRSSAKTLVLHWNGTAWARVASPNVNGNGNLFGVRALSPTDAWAVGEYTAGKGTKTLVLHWNGTRWVRVASPSPGRSPVNDSLAGVSALSPTDAWAVGEYTPRKTPQTLVLHWNGSRWAQVPSPSPRSAGIGPFTVLSDVSALSPMNAWAVGCACTSDTDTTLVLHWNGRTWTRS